MESDSITINTDIRLWGGRFQEKTNLLLENLNNSINYDRILWKQDIEGSIVYSGALFKIGLLSKQEHESIVNGLHLVHNEWKNDEFKIKPSDEDIHTANERRLKELIGSAAGKLHTGRSRNDQVALDIRMWLKEHIASVVEHVKQFLKVMLARVHSESDILMPGYTHLQRAQTVRWSQWILSHAWFLANDLKKLRNVFDSTDACPLGSGALAGNPFNIDRSEIAKQLGFSRPTPNSLLAVSDRDFIADYLYWCNLTAIHLSRFAEDLILYSSAEFGFVTLSDAFSTGSSIMPQKKNPDSLELIRGKAGRLTGNVTGFLCVLKGLPSTYNKDMQEDKEALIDSANTIEAVLQVATGVMATLKVNSENCKKGLTEDMLATDLAYYLVNKGVPFRSAHGMVGEVVQKTEELSCKLSEVPLEELIKISPHFDTDVDKLWSFEHSVEQYTAQGGTALSSVMQQAKDMEAFIENYVLQ